MTAYLEWLEDWGQAIDWGEIGKSDHEALNPPVLGDTDVLAWNWYHGEASMAFVRDNNLLPYLLQRLDLSKDAEWLFLQKLDLIYKSMRRIAEKAQKKTTDV